MITITLRIPQENKATITVSHSEKVLNLETGSIGYGHLHYIAYSELGYNAATNYQYLKDDYLYFRIIVELILRSPPSPGLTVLYYDSGVHSIIYLNV